MALTVGTLSGLAYKHDFYRDVQMELEMRRMDEIQKAQAFQESQYLMKAFEKGKASSPYFQEMLNQHSEGVIKQMGKFMRTNPDWKYNPEKFMQFQSLSNSLRDNEWTQRSENLLSQSQLLHDALKANPDLMKQKAFRDQFVQLSNLRNTGSIDGISENRKDYTFAPVEKWEDPLKIIADYANNNLVNREYASEGGWMVSRIPQQELGFGTKTLYGLHKEMFETYAAEAGVTAEEYVRNGLLMAGKNNAKIMPLPKGGRGRSGAGGSNADPASENSRWYTEIMQGSVGDHVNPEFSKALISGNQQHPVYLDGPNGMIPLQRRQILSVNTIGEDFKDPKMGTLNKTFNVTVPLTMEEAEKYGIIDDSWLSAPKVAAGKESVARIVEDKDGVKSVIVHARLPFSPNDKTFASAYNASARMSQDYGPENSTGLVELSDPTTGELFYYNPSTQEMTDANGERRTFKGTYSY